MSIAEPIPLPSLVSMRDMMAHTGKSYSTVSKWSSGATASPYPEPVRHNGRFLGWRREDIENADKSNRMSRADYLYGKTQS